MEPIALATFIFAVILALDIPTSSSVSPEAHSSPTNREISETQVAILEEFKSTSEIEKRRIAVYMAGKGATEWLESVSYTHLTLPTNREV